MHDEFRNEWSYCFWISWAPLSKNENENEREREIIKEIGRKENETNETQPHLWNIIQFHFVLNDLLPECDSIELNVMDAGDFISMRKLDGESQFGNAGINSWGAGASELNYISFQYDFIRVLIQSGNVGIDISHLANERVVIC